MPRPRPARIFWTPALLAATVALALGGCSGADADGGDGEPTAYDVPDVPVRLTAPAGWERAVAAGAVVGLAAVNYHGVTRTAGLTRVVVAVVLVALTVVVLAGTVGGSPRWSRVGLTGDDVSWYGVLQSAGLLFFAFAGYARIATMGEEVRDPARTIPRAILGAFAGAVAVYAVIAVTLLAVLGPQGTGATAAPLAALVQSSGWTWAEPVVRVGAAAASLGALLALVAGVGRTGLAMARNDDLPRWLAAVHPRYRVPHHAEIALAVVVCCLVLTVDLRGAIGIGCLALVVTLPAPAIAAGTAVLALGLGLRAWRRRGARTTARPG